MSNPEQGNNGESSDEQLMLAFARGDQACFDELFLRYRQLIYAFFRRRVLDKGRAEELTQEVFLALLRAASRYQPLSLFRTYVFSIAFRTLGADRRKSALRAFFFLPTAKYEPSTRSGIEERMWLRQALSRLDKTDREILMLREFEQLSYAEIAELLVLSLNTVRSRLFRARLALRDTLQGSVGPENTLLVKGDQA